MKHNGHTTQCCLVNCIVFLDRRPCSFVRNALSWLTHPFNQSEVQFSAANYSVKSYLLFLSAFNFQVHNGVFALEACIQQTWMY